MFFIQRSFLFVFPVQIRLDFVDARLGHSLVLQLEDRPGKGANVQCVISAKLFCKFSVLYSDIIRNVRTRGQ